MSADLNIMSRLHHYSPDSSPLESLAAIAVSEPPALPSRHSSGPPLAVHLQQQHSPLLPTWLCTFSPVVNPWCVWVTWAAGSKNRASNLAQNAPLRHRPSQYIEREREQLLQRQYSYVAGFSFNSFWEQNPNLCGNGRHCRNKRQTSRSIGEGSFMAERNRKSSKINP